MRRISDNLIPQFDSESPPELRLTGEPPPGTRVVWTSGGESLSGALESRIWRAERIPTPGAGEIEVVVGGETQARWAVRWDIPPERRPAVAALASRPSGAIRGTLPALEPEDRLWAGVELARRLSREGDAAGALEAWVSAAEVARVAQVPSETARRLRAAAFTAYGAQLPSRAEALLDQARGEEDRLDDPAGRARNDYYRGLVRQELADLRSALTLLRGAAEQAVALGLTDDAAMYRKQLAALLRDLGRHQEAEAELAGIEGWYGAQRSPRVRGSYLNDRAWSRLQAAADAGQVAPAVVDIWLAEARVLAHESADVPFEALVATHQALSAQLAGALDTARARIAEARALRPNARTALFLFILEGELTLAGGDASGALAQLDAVAIRAEQALGTVENEYLWRALYGAGRAARAAGRIEDALARWRRALDVVDAIGRRTLLQSARAPFFADRHRLVEDAAAALLASGQTALAFETLDAARARVLGTLDAPARLERLSQEQRKTWGTYVERYRVARARFEETRGDLDLSAGLALVRRRAQRETDRVELASTFEAAYAFLEGVAPAPAVPADLPAIQRALPTGTALVAYARLGAQWHALWVDASRVLDHPADRALDLAGLAHLFVVDGGWPGASQLAQADVSVSFLPYAGLLVRSSTAPSGPPLVVADPRLDLPRARAGGRALAARWPDARLLSGSDATLAAVMPALDGARLFHFAGHGVLRPADPWEAHLRLAGQEQLDVESLLLARPRVGVVMLAGCETGRAALLGGMEAIGLAQAFLLAGARTVVAADVPLADDEADAFTARFYALGGDNAPAAVFRRMRIERTPGAGSFRVHGWPGGAELAEPAVDVHHAPNARSVTGGTRQ